MEFDIKFDDRDGRQSHGTPVQQKPQPVQIRTALKSQCFLIWEYRRASGFKSARLPARNAKEAGV